MTTCELDVNDVRTRLRCAGPATDRDAVVFVRGNPGSGTAWELPLATVGDHGHRAVARDAPGFGRARWIRMTTATLRVRRPRLATLPALALVATALAGCDAEDRESSAATPLAARVRLPDGTLRTMTLVHQTGRAGIYRATASTRRGGLKAGWIVLDDGTQRGTTRQFIDPLSDLARTSAAPRLDTATGTVKFATAGTVTAAKLTEPGVIDIDLDR
jgi:hypothetical protein